MAVCISSVVLSHRISFVSRLNPSIGRQHIGVGDTSRRARYSAFSR